MAILSQQNDEHKDFPADVLEVVLSGCLNRLHWKAFYGQKEKNLAKEKMEQLGIIHLKKKCYRELSGGQHQRVLLARALCATKKMLILDEPAAGLDSLVTKELHELIYKINQEMGITIIMVSHDIQNVLRYAHKVLHLDTKQLFIGSAAEYYKTPLAQSFIEGRKNG